MNHKASRRADDRPTIASLFGGGGGWEVGALSCGIEPIWSVEWDPKLADMQSRYLHERAPSHRTIVGDVRSVDPKTLRRPTILVASPVCKAHSKATGGRFCDREDAWTGVATLRYVEELEPSFVAIENVPDYWKHPAFIEISKGLESLGYRGHTTVVDASMFGVPQSRRRLISRWTRLRHDLAPMPQVRGTSWYDAIEDLIPSFPKTKLAPWQVARIRRMLHLGVVGPWPWLVSSFNVSSERFKAGKVVIVARFANEPAWTVVSTPKAQTGLRVMFEDGRAVSVTPRGLARMQGFPDDYELLDARSAITVIGNAVPPPLSEAVCSSFLASMR